jgi:hypothetical protein
VIELVALALCLVLLTVASAQNWAVTLEPVVSMMLLLTHLQSILGIGLTGFPFSQSFKDTMSWLGIFSARVLDYYFSDCVLVGEGMTFYDKVAGFSAMPFIALLLASAAWLLVFLFPGMLKHHRAHNERLFVLTKRRSELILKLSRRTDPQGTPSHRISKAERHRRLTEQAELALVEDQLQENSKSQALFPLQDYRLLAIHSLQVVMFFTFHTVIYYCLTVFNCQKVPTGLGSSNSYLDTDNRISCDSPLYFQFRTIGYTVSIAFFVGIPGVYLFLYHLHLRHSPEKSLQRRQIFYVWSMGVKTGSWYWPAVIMIRKGLCSAIAAALPSPADAHITVWVYVVQLGWLLKLKPYWNSSNMVHEAISLASCIVGSSLCVLFEAYTAEEEVTTISAVLLAILLLPVPIFLYAATSKVWTTVREEIRAMHFETESDSEDSIESDDDDAIRAKQLKTMSIPAILREDEQGRRKDDLRHLDDSVAQSKDEFAPRLDATTKGSMPAGGEQAPRRHGTQMVAGRRGLVRSAPIADNNDEIPALMPPTWSSRLVHRATPSESSTESDEWKPMNGSVALPTRGPPAHNVDATTRRVFEEQLRHDEATRRETAIDEFMALEDEYLSPHQPAYRYQR